VDIDHPHNALTGDREIKHGVGAVGSQIAGDFDTLNSVACSKGPAPQMREAFDGYAAMLE
jgi:hypothetical protein